MRLNPRLGLPVFLQLICLPSALFLTISALPTFAAAPTGAEQGLQKQLSEPQSPPVVFGPRILTQPNEAVTFSVTNPAGPFWLQVSNGEAVQHAAPGQPGIITMQNLVTSGEVRLNGVLVANASDFDHNITRMFGFQKDVTLTSVNTLEAKLQGPAGSFITVEIREADPNSTVSNDRVDLTGTNMGDEIFLTWDYDDNAAEYVVFRAPSLNGPWTERFRLEASARGGGQVDSTPDAQ